MWQDVKHMYRSALVGSLAAAYVTYLFLRNIQTQLHELLPLSQNSNTQHHSMC